MVTTLLLGAIGMAVLSISASLLVDGASALGKRWNISDITIGIVVIAFGTSLPEFTVNMISAYAGSADLAIGNILGSNMANLLLILGIASLITPLRVRTRTTFTEVPFALLAAAVTATLTLDTVFDPAALQSTLSIADGLILLSFFVIFVYYIVSVAREAHETLGTDTGNEVNRDQESVKKLMTYIIAGIAGLVLSGTWVVNGAIELAHLAGLSETLIGLTIVSVGTSLPELAAAIASARRYKTDLVIGNLVGSNIFNTFWILGATALVIPIPILHEHYVSLMVNIVASALVFITLILGARHVLERWGGAVLITCYMVYLVLIAFGA